MEYKQKAIISFYLQQSLKEKINDRAIAKAVEAGWNGKDGREKVGKKPNISGTITEILRIGFIIIEQFGEDWRDSLALQSEPKWAAKRFDKLMAQLASLPTISVDEQAKVFEEIKDEMDLEGMLE